MHPSGLAIKHWPHLPSKPLSPATLEKRMRNYLKPLPKPTLEPVWKNKLSRPSCIPKPIKGFKHRRRTYTPTLIDFPTRSSAPDGSVVFPTELPIDLGFFPQEGEHEVRAPSPEFELCTTIQEELESRKAFPSIEVFEDKPPHSKTKAWWTIFRRLPTPEWEEPSAQSSVYFRAQQDAQIEHNAFIARLMAAYPNTGSSEFIVGAATEDDDTTEEWIEDINNLPKPELHTTNNTESTISSDNIYVHNPLYANPSDLDWDYERLTGYETEFSSHTDTVLSASSLQSDLNSSAWSDSLLSLGSSQEDSPRDQATSKVAASPTYSLDEDVHEGVSSEELWDEIDLSAQHVELSENVHAGEAEVGSAILLKDVTADELPEMEGGFNYDIGLRKIDVTILDTAAAVESRSIGNIGFPNSKENGSIEVGIEESRALGLVLNLINEEDARNNISLESILSSGKTAKDMREIEAKLQDWRETLAHQFFNTPPPEEDLWEDIYLPIETVFVPKFPGLGRSWRNTTLVRQIRWHLQNKAEVVRRKRQKRSGPVIQRYHSALGSYFKALDARSRLWYDTDEESDE